MGEAKHTKAPWNIIYGGLSIDDSGFQVGSKIEAGVVAECWPPNADLERRRRMLADARLIAAAPNLLAAAKAVVAAYSGLHWEGKRIDPDKVADLMEAIEAAEGKQGGAE
jgi:hypothetical protein